LIETVSPARVVVGTDYPFPIQDLDPVGSLGRLTSLTSEERATILYDNAARLLGLPVS
jgi:predicted TIM-barrel fold metal-dependent hydrolase